jgi:hypothetical protein
MTPDQSQGSARPTAYKATFSSHGTKNSNPTIGMDWIGRLILLGFALA